MHVWDATWTADSFFFLSPLRYTKRGMIIRNKYQVNKYPLMIPWSYCEDNLMLEGISFLCCILARGWMRCLRIIKRCRKNKDLVQLVCNTLENWDAITISDVRRPFLLSPWACFPDTQCYLLTHTRGYVYRLDMWDVGSVGTRLGRNIFLDLNLRVWKRGGGRRKGRDRDVSIESVVGMKK